MVYFISRQFLETIAVVVMFCLVIVAGRFFDKKIVEAKGKKQRTLKYAKVFIEGVKFAVLVMLIFVGMKINGVNVSAAMQSLGIASIIVGFALNDYLKDIVMGFSILLENYFKVGDSVRYQDRIGKVVSFNLKTTKIFMYDTEETMIVCNRNISQISRPSDWVDIDVPIAYSVDPAYARELCKICAKRIERLRYVYYCEFMNTQNFESSWITYKLRVHHLVEKYYMVRRNANSVVQDVFKEFNVEFPLGITVLYDGKEIDGNAQRRPIDHNSTNSLMARKDNAFGRGAEVSKRIAFDRTDDSISKCILEAERYAHSENLSKKMSLRIRLLSEELLSMAKNIDYLRDGSFCVERADRDYEILLDATTFITKDLVKELRRTARLSSENTEGTSSLIKDAIDSMIQRQSEYKGKDQLEYAENAMEESIGRSEDNLDWSYNVYCEVADANKPLDEAISEEMLVKSVLTSLADDIKVSMAINKLRIRVLVKDIEET